MKVNKDHVEMVADKIRGYHFHNADGLVAITFRGDWVMHNTGWLLNMSSQVWTIPDDELNSRSETLEKKITDIAKYCEDGYFVGVDRRTTGVRMTIQRWFEEEKEARKMAVIIGRRKLWDCKNKQYV